MSEKAVHSDLDVTKEGDAGKDKEMLVAGSVSLTWGDDGLNLFYGGDAVMVDGQVVSGAQIHFEGYYPKKLTIVITLPDGRKDFYEYSKNGGEGKSPMLRHIKMEDPTLMERLGWRRIALSAALILLFGSIAAVAGVDCNGAEEELMEEHGNGDETGSKKKTPRPEDIEKDGFC